MLRRHIEELGLDRAHRRGHRADRSATARVTGLALRRRRAARGRPGRLLGRHPAPRRAGPRGRARRSAERGGVLVDEQLPHPRPARLGDRRVRGAGGRMYGLVAPGYAMAEVVADALLGGPGTLRPARTCPPSSSCSASTWRRFGDAFATTEGALEVVFADPVAGVYKKLVVTEDGRPLLGGILVGDASAYGALRPMVGVGIALPGQPGGADPAGRPAAADRARRCPTRRQVCSCNNVTKDADPRRAIAEERLRDVAVRQGAAPGPAPAAAPACRW